MDILIATMRPDNWRAFAASLEAEGAAPQFAESGGDALLVVTKTPPALVIFDQDLPDGDPLELARKLLYVNALVNIAVVDARDEKAFHDAAEGLGVMAQLPPTPSAEDGAAVGQRLRRILGLTQQSIIRQRPPQQDASKS